MKTLQNYIKANKLPLISLEEKLIVNKDYDLEDSFIDNDKTKFMIKFFAPHIISNTSVAILEGLENAKIQRSRTSPYNDVYLISGQEVNSKTTWEDIVMYKNYNTKTNYAEYYKEVKDSGYNTIAFIILFTTKNTKGFEKLLSMKGDGKFYNYEEILEIVDANHDGFPDELKKEKYEIVTYNNK